MHVPAISWPCLLNHLYHPAINPTCRGDRGKSIIRHATSLCCDDFKGPNGSKWYKQSAYMKLTHGLQTKLQRKLIVTLQDNIYNHILYTTTTVYKMYKTIYTTFLDILPGWCAFRFQEMTSASRKQEVLESWAFYILLYVSCFKSFKTTWDFVTRRVLSTIAGTLKALCAMRALSSSGCIERNRTHVATAVRPLKYTNLIWSIMSLHPKASTMLGGPLGAA